MNFLLKGITRPTTIAKTYHIPIDGYDFDLRPQSFNFTQIKNIKEIISLYPLNKYSLIFENEKPFMIDEIVKKIGSSEKDLGVEICGNIDFEAVDELDLEYSWRFQEESKFSNIKRAKNLKKIILSHKSLEIYLESGELFGFLQLFNDPNFDNIDFELLLDWDTKLIESTLEQLEFSFISFDINSKVEHSYQNPNEEIIVSELERYRKQFN